MQVSEIRLETASDEARVREIQQAAFGRPGEARLVDALRLSAKPALSLVAEVEGRVAGHVFVSPVEVVEGPPGSYGGLAPLGVLPRLQRAGVGSALMVEALKQCSVVGWDAIFLLGSPAYYARFGFVSAPRHGYHYESEYRDIGPAGRMVRRAKAFALFDRAFQVCEIRTGALSGAGGWVRYHDAFREL